MCGDARAENIRSLHSPHPLFIFVRGCVRVCVRKGASVSALPRAYPGDEVLARLDRVADLRVESAARSRSTDSWGDRLPSGRANGGHL
eukprot:4488842-Pleurochrysis_carterae.AAC.2